MASRLQMATLLVRVPLAIGISREYGKCQAQGRHHDAEQTKAILATQVFNLIRMEGPRQEKINHDG